MDQKVQMEMARLSAEIEELLDQMHQEIAPLEAEFARQHDRSIPGKWLPVIIADGNCYDQTVRRLLYEYLAQMEKKPALQRVQGLCRRTRETVELILHALHCERSGDTQEARSDIMKLLRECMNVPFFVSELDSSYAFRGVAPFEYLQASWVKPNYYVPFISTPLTFYRCREKTFTQKTDLLHVPLGLRSKIKPGRYSLPGIPCLYLASTSYCCWKELGEPEVMSGACFTLTEQGKKLKILNMVFSPALIHGEDHNPYQEISPLSFDMRRLLPLVLASSISVRPHEEVPYRPEYTIPHLIMRCLKELGIDGVAYMSTRNDDEFQFPHGINLALPVFEEGHGAKYGKICDCFKVSSPMTLDLTVKTPKPASAPSTQSYVNAMNWTDFNASIIYQGARCLYRETPFSCFDDELASSPF